MDNATVRRFTHRKESRYTLYRRLGGPQGRSERVRKISLPTGIWSSDRPARSESLYELSYPGPIRDSTLFYTFKANCLRPCGNYLYHLLWHDSYVSHNKQRLFHYTALEEMSKVMEINCALCAVRATTSYVYRVRINYRRISLRHNFRDDSVWFILWDFVKDHVYAPPLPETLPEFRQRINTAIGNVTQDMFERVWREWEYRLDICRVTRGAHIECL